MGRHMLAATVLVVVGASAALAFAPSDSKTHHYVLVANQTAGPITASIENQGISATAPAGQTARLQSLEFRWNMAGSRGFYRGVARNSTGVICQAVFRASVSNGTPTLCEVTAPSDRCATSTSVLGNSCSFTLTVSP